MRIVVYFLIVLLSCSSAFSANGDQQKQNCENNGNVWSDGNGIEASVCLESEEARRNNCRSKNGEFKLDEYTNHWYCDLSGPNEPKAGHSTPDQDLITTCNNITKLLQDCTDKSKSAETSCDSEKDNSLLAISDNLPGISRTADSMTGGAMACSQAVMGIRGASSVFAEFQRKCRDKRSQCEKACEKVPDKETMQSCVAANLMTLDKKMEESKKLADATKKCDDTKVVETQGNSWVQEVQQSVAESMACRQALGSTPMPQSCFTNPSTPECAALFGTGDCNDPKMKMTPTCACRNGNTAECMQATGQMKLGGGNIDLASKAPGASGGNSNPAAAGKNDWGSATDGLAFVPGKPGSAEDIGGRMGGAGIDSGSGGGGGGGRPGGAAGGGSGIDANINGGFRGGGGGAWGSAGGSGSQGAGGGANGSGGVAGQGYPNLNKFRPNLTAPQGRRDLAGVTGPDGLLGPHANFWTTIKNRYHYEWRQGSLRP